MVRSSELMRSPLKMTDLPIQATTRRSSDGRFVTADGAGSGGRATSFVGDASRFHILGLRFTAGTPTGVSALGPAIFTGDVDQRGRRCNGKMVILRLIEPASLKPLNVALSPRQRPGDEC